MTRFGILSHSWNVRAEQAPISVCSLTHYCLTGAFVPALLKFQFRNKEGSSKIFPMSIAPLSR